MSGEGFAGSFGLSSFAVSDEATLVLDHGDALWVDDMASFVMDGSDQYVIFPIFFLGEEVLLRGFRDPVIGSTFEYTSTARTGRLDLKITSQPVPTRYQIVTGEIEISEGGVGARAKILQTGLHVGPFIVDLGGDSKAALELEINSNHIPAQMDLLISTIEVDEIHIETLAGDRAGRSIGLPIFLQNNSLVENNTNLTISLQFQGTIGEVRSVGIAVASESAGPYLAVDTGIESTPGTDTTNLNVVVSRYPSYVIIYELDQPEASPLTPHPRDEAEPQKDTVKADELDQPEASPLTPHPRDEAGPQKDTVRADGLDQLEAIPSTLHFSDDAGPQNDTASTEISPATDFRKDGVSTGYVLVIVIVGLSLISIAPLFQIIRHKWRQAS